MVGAQRAQRHTVGAARPRPTRTEQSAPPVVRSAPVCEKPMSAQALCVPVSGPSAWLWLYPTRAPLPCPGSLPPSGLQMGEIDTQEIELLPCSRCTLLPSRISHTLTVLSSLPEAISVPVYHARSRRWRRQCPVISLTCDTRSVA